MIELVAGGAAPPPAGGRWLAAVHAAGAGAGGRRLGAAGPRTAPCRPSPAVEAELVVRLHLLHLLLELLVAVLQLLDLAGQQR